MQFKIDGHWHDLIVDNSEDSKVTYRLLKLLIKNADLDLAKAARKFNRMYPDEKTTSQNLSNKLYRDSLRVIEFLKLLNALGYVISFDSADSANSTEKEAAKPSANEMRFKDFKFDDLLFDGYTDCKSINFDTIIIAGARATEAAQWIEDKLSTSKEIDETQEIMLLIAANREFKVICKPISSNRHN